MAETNKIIVIGVGNSGTRVLGKLLYDLLYEKDRPLKYYYEPLYWQGDNGDKDIVINDNAIKAHTGHPLLPDKSEPWPFIDSFMDSFTGIAKFIRLGSRIHTVIDRPVKFIWITRELFSFLGSMQKNFPRALPKAGWHHRPGEYDDYKRLSVLYEKYALREEEEYRVEVEAAWWHLHNQRIFEFSGRSNVLHIRYEDLCSNPKFQMQRLCKFIDILYRDSNIKFHNPYEHMVQANPSSLHKILRIAGNLNKLLYPENEK